jgi:hypothetical protein
VFNWNAAVPCPHMSLVGPSALAAIGGTSEQACRESVNLTWLATFVSPIIRERHFAPNSSVKSELLKVMSPKSVPPKKAPEKYRSEHMWQWSDSGARRQSNMP